MDIELLKTFIEVTQTRHFGRAADNLFLTPAAVSARIRQLEQTLGVTLFYRTRGNIQPTAEGQRLLPHAHRLLAAWAEARQDLTEKPELSESVSVGATPGLWHFALHSFSRHLQKSLPEIGLRAEAYPQEELFERLLAKQLDMVVVYDLPGNTALRSRRVGQLKLALLSNHPDLSLKAALAGDYVYVDWGAAFALFHARRFGEVHSRLYTNQASVALASIKGQGEVGVSEVVSAYLPSQLAVSADVLSAGTVGAMADLASAPLAGVASDVSGLNRVSEAPEFTRPLYAAYRADQEFSPVVQQAIDVLASIKTF